MSSSVQSPTVLNSLNWGWSCPLQQLNTQKRTLAVLIQNPFLYIFFLSMYLRPYYPIIDFVVLKHAPAKDAAKSQVWIFKLHEYDFYRDTLLDSLCCIWSWPVCKAVVGWCRGAACHSQLGWLNTNMPFMFMTHSIADRECQPRPGQGSLLWIHQIKLNIYFLLCMLLLQGGQRRIFQGSARFSM